MKLMTIIACVSALYFSAGCTQYKLGSHRIDREAIAEVRPALDNLMSQYDLNKDGTIDRQEAGVLVEDIETALELKEKIDAIKEEHPRLYNALNWLLKAYEEARNRETN